MRGREGGMRPWAAALALAALLSGCARPLPEETPAPTPTSAQTPAPTQTPTPTPEPAVYTDWSKLEPYEPLKPVYTRQREEFMYRLEPADDYGPLIPFEGTEAFYRYDGCGDEEERDYSDTPNYLYGLVTQKGQVVLDPILQEVWDPTGEGDAYLLSLGDVCAVCAQDGSWCTDFVYEIDIDPIMFFDRSQGVTLLKNETQLVLFDTKTGTEALIADETVFSQSYPELSFFWDVVLSYQPGEPVIPIWHTDYIGQTREETCYIYDTSAHTLTFLPGVRYVGDCSEGLIAAATEEGTYGYLDVSGQWAIEPVYTKAQVFRKGRGLVRTQEGNYLYLDRSGDVVYALPEGYELGNNSGDCTEFYSETASIWLDSNYVPLDIPVVGRATTPWSGGFYWEENGHGVFWLDGRRYDLPVLGRISAREGSYVLQSLSGAGNDYVLTNLDTGDFHTFQGFVSMHLWKNDTTVYLAGFHSNWDSYEYFDVNGDPYTPPEREEEPAPTEGLITDSLGAYYLLKDQKGNVVFRWPIPSGRD